MLIAALLVFAAPVLADQQTNIQPAATPGAQSMAQGEPQQGGFAGVQPVSPEEVAGKVGKIVDRVYSMAGNIAPKITVLVLIVGGLLLALFKEARKVIIWSIVGLILVLWAQQVVGLIIGLMNS
ncbi:hypothetical protein SAMN02745218_01220 [Desulfofundulus australicus DSM 11792]|uniref:TrbC/VIRB2 family protein n=1 Tax=Desulfofundulus australicus DSM 11792 TaxID=1121425 RepID=A0A1M4XZ10_9FIRM|nr:hypothetical protein SAMN02745218_01220 [Desulfofundulus australicus DSM 11792]